MQIFTTFACITLICHLEPILATPVPLEKLTGHEQSTHEHHHVFLWKRDFGGGPQSFIIILIATLVSIIVVCKVTRCALRANRVREQEAPAQAARTAAANSLNTALVPSYTPVALSDAPPPYTALAAAIASGDISQQNAVASQNNGDVRV
ncbi:hypothetical protein M427DRAFT_55180 [Gonapodya prolifera JEL478]|uniref:Uncharacterized protein n=1 Tax=Gonapodya prolifera (strain JEL478) TaxID=1344416 RepID=A0A139AJ73_GONPJ|nr:hypothetical protein M427DRAFT_55180 [Gonapodya prolifera JEL478]|eukprot:KXS16840.1 hypothetical protein M427DRAFT_55180 [Gonapodya prolifera JEL478]